MVLSAIVQSQKDLLYSLWSSRISSHLPKNKKSSEHLSNFIVHGANTVINWIHNWKSCRSDQFRQSSLLDMNIWIYVWDPSHTRTLSSEKESRFLCPQYRDNVISTSLIWKIPDFGCKGTDSNPFSLTTCSDESHKGTRNLSSLWLNSVLVM